MILVVRIIVVELRIRWRRYSYDLKYDRQKLELLCSLRKKDVVVETGDPSGRF